MLLQLNDGCTRCEIEVSSDMQLLYNLLPTEILLLIMFSKKLRIHHHGGNPNQDVRVACYAA